ncbi:hypothetical protein [Andreprevotia chitinilytica]|uniref:hypothetical protein n=1 Tax=Andreprevotia chitinilytica TaxID=396808 RepID=UPI0012EBC1AA|nr:hypothetical protein [Andreprevotia chitinilytica]
MAQNLISLHLDRQQLSAIDQALTTLEDNLVGPIVLTPQQRSWLVNICDKSGAFCR